MNDMLRSRRAVVAVALVSLVASASELALAGDVSPGRIIGEFFFTDGEEPGIGGSVIAIQPTEFAVQGAVEGIGTDGDEVTIVFVTPLPTNVNADDQQGRVRQSRFSSLIITIDSSVPERNLELTINPEKCAIDGKVNVPKDEGQVSIDCSGTNIYSEISASEEASIQAAFQGTKKVKFKVNSDGSKGSLQIRLKGPLGPSW
jgi:hypothetical protein